MADTMMIGTTTAATTNAFLDTMFLPRNDS
jgi:hypothetical protein